MSRHFPQVGDIDFAWAGPGRSTDQRNKFRVIYDECRVNGVNICTGDFVLLESDGVDCICQVLELFDPGLESDDRSPAGTVQWYWQLDELRAEKRIRRKIESMFSNPHPKEVFLDASNMIKEKQIELETIKNKCYIIGFSADFDLTREAFDLAKEAAGTLNLVAGSLRYPVFPCRFRRTNEEILPLYAGTVYNDEVFPLPPLNKTDNSKLLVDRRATPQRDTPTRRRRRSATPSRGTTPTKSDETPSSQTPSRRQTPTQRRTPSRRGADALDEAESTTTPKESTSKRTTPRSASTSGRGNTPSRSRASPRVLSKDFDALEAKTSDKRSETKPQRAEATKTSTVAPKIVSTAEITSTMMDRMKLAKRSRASIGAGKSTVGKEDADETLPYKSSTSSSAISAAGPAIMGRRLTLGSGSASGIAPLPPITLVKDIKKSTPNAPFFTRKVDAQKCFATRKLHSPPSATDKPNPTGAVGSPPEVVSPGRKLNLATAKPTQKFKADSVVDHFMSDSDEENNNDLDVDHSGKKHKEQGEEDFLGKPLKCLKELQNREDGVRSAAASNSKKPAAVDNSGTSTSPRTLRMAMRRQAKSESKSTSAPLVVAHMNLGDLRDIDEIIDEVFDSPKLDEKDAAAPGKGTPSSKRSGKSAVAEASKNETEVAEDEEAASSKALKKLTETEAGPPRGRGQPKLLKKDGSAAAETKVRKSPAKRREGPGVDELEKTPSKKSRDIPTPTKRRVSVSAPATPCRPSAAAAVVVEPPGTPVGRRTPSRSKATPTRRLAAAAAEVAAAAVIVAEEATPEKRGRATPTRRKATEVEVTPEKRVRDTPTRSRRDAVNYTELTPSPVKRHSESADRGADQTTPAKMVKHETPSKRERKSVAASSPKAGGMMTPKRNPPTPMANGMKTPKRNPPTPKAKGMTTPKRNPPTPSRKAHDMTPGTKARTTSVVAPGNQLEAARARLHVSAVPDSLPCRDNEFTSIFNFVRGNLTEGIGGCMYVSGVPGTGKTATVREVMRALEEEKEAGRINEFRFIDINGMRLTDPRQAYVSIYKELVNEKATADHACNLLDKRFSTSGPRRQATVLLVDELDLLMTPKQDVLYNLFDWPSRQRAKLTVLAIANTMDLPERVLMNRVSSRLGLTRLIFQPYTFKQLQEIVVSRTTGLKCFSEEAIQFAARKVAAVSGDARRALDICRRATEIAEREANHVKKVLVSMGHVQRALDEMYSSPLIVAIKNCSVHEQILLRAVVAEFRERGVEDALFHKVYDQHVALCRFEGISIPTMSEFCSVCNHLNDCRLLLLEPGKLDLYRRVRLNISIDDVNFALRDVDFNLTL